MCGLGTGPYFRHLWKMLTSTDGVRCMWTCGTPQWITPTNINIIAPPNDTMAIIVDVRLKEGENGGTFFIMRGRATNTWL